MRNAVHPSLAFLYTLEKTSNIKPQGLFLNMRGRDNRDNSGDFIIFYYYFVNGTGTHCRPTLRQKWYDQNHVKKLYVMIWNKFF